MKHNEQRNQSSRLKFQLTMGLTRLIDRAIEYGGSYFLTYHRWADRRQVETCYPQMADFIKLKKHYDPHEMFQSDWYRHYRHMFAGAG